jgi:acid phosphatase (class A)
MRLILIILVLLASAAWASAAGVYLDPELDLTLVLPSPPETSSMSQRRDLESVVSTQKGATAERVASAIADAHESLEQVGKDVLGSDFTEGKAPKTFAMFQGAISEMGTMVSKAKDHWQRPRPFTVDDRVACLTDKPSNFAYPSGAAALAYEATTILGMMIPEKQVQLMHRAAEFSHSRIIVGVHYPTDVSAGQIAGTFIASTLLRDQNFARDLKEATEELRDVLGYR